MQPVVVYDTNVLISGMIWGGIPYRCIELAQQDAIVVLCLPGTPGPNQYGESANIGKRKTCKHLTNT